MNERLVRIILACAVFTLVAVLGGIIMSCDIVNPPEPSPSPSVSPTPEPTPTPTATPTPEPTPDTWGCEAPFPERTYADGRPHWSIKSKPQNRVIDTTAVVVNQLSYCQAIGMGWYDGDIPRAECPMRPEGDPLRVPCEQYIAEGVWVTDGRNGAICKQKSDNPAQFYANNENCRLCNPAKTVCSDWW